MVPQCLEPKRGRLVLPDCPGGGDMATDEAKSIGRVGLAQGCHTLLLHQRATSGQKEAQWATFAYDV